jgi:hypothetical protein
MKTFYFSLIDQNEVEHTIEKLLFDKFYYGQYKNKKLLKAKIEIENWQLAIDFMEELEQRTGKKFELKEV